MLYISFLPLIVHCSLAVNIREKLVQHLLQAIPFSPFPHLLHQKDSPAPAVLAAGAGHFFLPFPIQPHPLTPLIMARKRKTSLETFQSNMTKTSTKCYVNCNAVSWFSICSFTRLDSCTSVYDIIEPCSTVFKLGIKKSLQIQASAILVSLEFDFHGPRKGDFFVQFCFWGHLFFSVHISFIKSKYFSLVFSFSIDCKPLIMPNGEMCFGSKLGFVEDCNKIDQLFQ